MKKNNIMFVIAISILSTAMLTGCIAKNSIDDKDKSDDPVSETEIVNTIAKENKVTFTELPIEMVLPQGYTMNENDKKDWNASFGSYDVESHQKQGLQPTIYNIEFFSEESINKFTEENCDDTTPSIDNVCSNGGYPGLDNYMAEKEAFTNLSDTYNNSELKKFNERYYFSSQNSCMGDSCKLYKYTTYIDNVKIDIIIISWSENGQTESDELFREVTILDKK